MADVIFRDATRADLPAVVALLVDDALGATREELTDPLHPGYGAGFEAIAANPNDRLVVAEQDGVVVGCLQLSFIAGISHRGAWRGQIEGVRVSADLRGQGVGRRFMEWAIEQCRAKGCRMVQLTTNNAREDAHRFYRGLGFVGSHLGMKLVLA